MTVRTIDLCWRLPACALAFLAMALTTSRASGETEISGYFGFAHTFDSDVRLTEPNDTDLTFRGVSWDDESFKSPIYYGLRVTQWFGKDENWGVAVELTHAKMVGELDRPARVTGIREGDPVNADESLGETFQRLSFSHGHNLITLNGRYRWTVTDKLLPYVGLGAGFARPHVEVDLGGGKRTESYQLAGPAAQGFVGLQFRVTELVSVFGEAKLTYTDISADLTGGGKIEVEPWTGHLLAGISLSF